MVKLPVFNENDSGAHSLGSAVICRFFFFGEGGWGGLLERQLH